MTSAAQAAQVAATVGMVITGTSAYKAAALTDAPGYFCSSQARIKAAFGRHATGEAEYRRGNFQDLALCKLNWWILLLSHDFFKK